MPKSKARRDLGRKRSSAPARNEWRTRRAAESGVTGELDVEQTFTAALSPLPCPVGKEPMDGGEETYCTFNEVLGTYEAHASNQPRRLNHMMQLHVFSRRDDGTHRELFFRAVELLRAAGVKVRHYGPDDYETDTGYHHIAATCEWSERLT